MLLKDLHIWSLTNKADLLHVLQLQENKKMFNGMLGIYQHKKVHMDIDPNAKP